MSIGQKFIPYKGVELDVSELDIDDMKAFFIRNLTFTSDDNDRIDQGQGSNAYKFTKLIANEKYSNLELPAGMNYCVGFHYVPELNFAFVMGWNSNNNHFVYRIDCNTGTFVMVSVSPCWNFQLDPKHFICLGRATHSIIKRTNKLTGLTEDVVYMVITDNFNDQRFFCDKDLIDSGGFNENLHAYFTRKDQYDSKCYWFNLGVPTPLQCIGINPIKRNPADEEEKRRQSLLNYKGWQFRIVHIDQWNRNSEFGIISDVFFNQIGNSCIATSTGLSRCLRLKIPAGSPLINQIQIHFRNCIGDVKGQSLTTDWYRHNTISKYDDCDDKQWFERDISNPWQVEYAAQIAAGKTAEEATEIANSKNLLKYIAADNTFEYTFCADKERVPVDVNKTNRIENFLPQRSSTVFPLGTGIALGRNTRDFEPLDCNELGKVEYGVELPEASVCSTSKNKKIEIWGIIYNPNEGEITGLRYKNDQVIFSYSDCNKNNGIAYGQVLPKDQEGIIGHLKGTDFYCISKQYTYNVNTGEVVYKGLSLFTDQSILAEWASGILVVIQKWEFEVPPGKYRFHLASHQSGPTDDYKKTSTNFIGTTSLSNIGQLLNERRELIVDVCTADYVLKDTPIMIWDLTNVGSDCNASSALTGYLYEDDTENRPLEMAQFRTSQDGDIFKCSYTDHNGYYFATRQGRLLTGYLYGYKDCTVNQLLATTRETRDQEKWWWRHDVLFAYRKGINGTYPAVSRMLVKGKVVLCDDANVGVPGVVVNLTRAGVAITDSNGEFSIAMHDIGNGGTRSDQIIISQKPGCQILACQDDCVYCFETKTVNSTPCSPTVPRVINVTTYTVRVNQNQSKGPKMGGRYGTCIFMHDWMGRRSYAQVDENSYLDMPSFQQTKVYGFSKIKFNLNGCVFPSWTKKITFGITDNLNWDKDLTWVAERIQFVDATGKTNSVSPTQIRLYYESLNEYNKQNDYSTNSTWQFLTSDENSVQGDIIEFLAMSDGTPYDKKITALAKYDREGRYVTIDFTEELKDLKDGTLIKLIRPNREETEQFYYEICPSIDVVDGVATVQSGYINYYDSYIISRQIPVPVAKKGTTTNEDGEIIDTETSENQMIPYPFFFEHHSPADTWGAYCRNRGRVGVKNPHERKRVVKMEIAVSNALANDGVLNGLHYFESKDSIVFDDQQWGGISLCIPEINTVLVLCEFDNFITVYNDDSVSVDSQGNVRANAAENRFSRPDRKIGSNFGCQLDDINTVRKKDGFVLFLDASESAIIKHNYGDAEDITESTPDKGGYKSYILALVKYVQNWNIEHPNNKKYFHAVIDPKKDDYIFTVASIKQNSPQYINNERGYSVLNNDTIGINIYSNVLNSFRSYVPEYYGAMKRDKNDLQLISFRFGEAWKHYDLNREVSVHNRFYDVDVDSVIEVVANIDSEKVKTYVHTEVYCTGQLYYIDRIITESGQQSRLMPRWFEKRSKFFCADFKCATNTVPDVNLPVETGANALLDGDVLTGRWMRARYINKIAERNKYSELTSIAIYVEGVEQTGVKK